MSDRTDAQHAGAAAQEHGSGGAGGNSQGNGHQPAKTYKFSVDGRRFETEQPRLTGLQIKAMAGVAANFGLFLEGRGQGSDRQIGDGEPVDLSEPRNESFYTAPPATYGGLGGVGAGRLVGRGTPVETRSATADEAQGE